MIKLLALLALSATLLSALPAFAQETDKKPTSQLEAFQSAEEPEDGSTISSDEWFMASKNWKVAQATVDEENGEHKRIIQLILEPVGESDLIAANLKFIFESGVVTAAKLKEADTVTVSVSTIGDLTRLRFEKDGIEFYSNHLKAEVIYPEIDNAKNASSDKTKAGETETLRQPPVHSAPDHWYPTPDTEDFEDDNLPPRVSIWLRRNEDEIVNLICEDPNVRAALFRYADVIVISEGTEPQSPTLKVMMNGKVVYQNKAKRVITTEK